MGKERHMKLLIEGQCSVADPDLKLKWSPVFFACPAGFSSFCDSPFFFSGNKGGGGGTGGPGPQAPPLDPFAGVSLTNKLELNNYDDDLFRVVYFHRRL